MAHIQLPPSGETKSRSEEAIYQIASALSDDWYVWMNRELDFMVKGCSMQREVDCILYHKKFGMLVIECKDGKIASRYDSTMGGQIWTQNGHKMDRSPAEQARTLTPPLHDFFGVQFLSVKDTRARVRVQWAACFADMESAERLPTNELPAERLLLKSDLLDVATFESRVINILNMPEVSHGGHAFPNDILRDESFDRLLQFLGSYDEPSLLELWDVENRARVLPTLMQEMLMESIQRNPKVMIEGVAGSGKSMLVLWEARRLAKMKMRVALVCYNELLADSFEKTFKDENLDEFIEVHNFAKWCQKYVTLAKVPGAPRKEPKEAAAKSLYYNERLPEGFKAALQILRDSKKGKKRLFDAVLVDEGQDLMCSWLDAILQMLESPEEGVVRFFCDPRQKLYSGRNWKENEALAKFPVLVLSRGYRSTKKILEWVRIMTGITVPAYNDSPTGKSPTVKLYKEPSEQIAMLDECIKKLEEQGVARSDILVVSLRSKRHSALQNLDEMKYRWTDTGDHNLSDHLVNVVSTHRIKGLDSKVVILTDMERNRNAPNEPHHQSATLLVAATRAKSKLIVFRQK